MTDPFLPGTFSKENSGRYVGISSPCWGIWNEEESSSGEEDDLTQPPALMENYEEDYSSDEESLLSLEDVEQKEKENYAMDESFFDYFGEHVNQDVFMVKAAATRKISNNKSLGDSGASSRVCNDMKYMGKSNPCDEKTRPLFRLRRVVWLTLKLQKVKWLIWTILYTSQSLTGILYRLNVLLLRDTTMRCATC